MNTRRHFLDCSLPAQGRAARTRKSWMSMGGSRPLGGVEAIEQQQEPGDGSA